MGSMPHWFAKTKEMAAFDRYFSTPRRRRQGSARPLPGRRLGAWTAAATSSAASDALDHEWRGIANRGTRWRVSLDEHFRGDWIHLHFPDDPEGRTATSAAGSGPRCRRTDVIDGCGAGVMFAIHKAMGDTELANLGLGEDYRDRLWKAERDNGIDIDDGIRGIALSWNCVAPAGDNFFEVDALRGPTRGRVRHRHAAPVRPRHRHGHGRRCAGRPHRLRPPTDSTEPTGSQSAS